MIKNAKNSTKSTLKSTTTWGELENKRKRLGLTQQELADIIGVVVRTYDKWRDTRSAPKYAIVIVDLLIEQKQGVYDREIVKLVSENGELGKLFASIGRVLMAVKKDK